MVRAHAGLCCRGQVRLRGNLQGRPGIQAKERPENSHGDTRRQRIGGRRGGIYQRFTKADHHEAIEVEGRKTNAARMIDVKPQTTPERPQLARRVVGAANVPVERRQRATRNSNHQCTARPHVRFGSLQQPCGVVQMLQYL